MIEDDQSTDAGLCGLVPAESPPGEGKESARESAPASTFNKNVDVFIKWPDDGANWGRKSKTAPVGQFK